MERHYSPEDIEIVDPIRHIRLHATMYVRDLAQGGLHDLVEVLADNVLDEVATGHCTRVEVCLESDGTVHVTDDGPGISVAHHSGKTLLEHVFTSLAACVCGCPKPPGHRRSLVGSGLPVVTALSERLTVETNWEGARHRLSFERGQRLADVEALGPAEAPGTHVRFRPDREIFEPDVTVDREWLLELLRGAAAVFPGLHAELTDLRHGAEGRDAIQYGRGLPEFVASLVETPGLAEPIEAVECDPRAEPEGAAEVRLALQVELSEHERLIGFVNGTRLDAGTHVDGLRLGLDEGFAAAAAELGIEREARPTGLLAVVAVDLPDPELEPTPSWHLTDPGAVALVARAARNAIIAWARAQPAEAHAVFAERRHQAP